MHLINKMGKVPSHEWSKDIISSPIPQGSDFEYYEWDNILTHSWEFLLTEEELSVQFYFQ